GVGDGTELVMQVRADALPAGAACERGLEHAPFAAADEHAPVGDAGPHDGGGEPVGVPDGPGGHESPMAPAADPEPLRIGDAVGDEQVDAGEDVGPLLLADGPGDGGG